MIRLWIRLAVFLMGVLAWQPLQAQWFEREAAKMGTRIYVQIWHTDQKRAHQIIDQVMTDMERINQLMSPYLPTSELSKINQKAAAQPVPVSDELFHLIEDALNFGALSQGAFDITFASLGHRYEYRKKIKPTELERKKAAALIDYRDVILDKKNRTVAFRHEGMRMDLGGIAKGHAVDNGIAILKKSGVLNGIVTAGGDSRLLGDRHGRPWVLGIRHPRGEGSVISLPLDNISVSTSGDYERYFEEDGVRYHHIIDPKKGDSARGLLSATILTERSTTADALSTTVFILGVKKGLDLVNRLDDVSAILIDRTGKVHYSSDLEAP